MSAQPLFLLHGRWLVSRAGLLLVAVFVASYLQPGASAQSGSANQEPPTIKSTSPANSQAEVATSDTPTTFRIHVNVVLVRAVVRDQEGKVIEGLKKEDFQLLDDNKPQIISTFAVERPTFHSRRVEAGPAEVEANAPSATVAFPERFVALVFDDIHLNMEDAVFARSAANKVLDTITAADRVGIYSTSGAIDQDFTKDLGVLRNTILRVIPRPLYGNSTGNDCPNISYFQAEQMLKFRDTDAIGMANADALVCAYNDDPRLYGDAVRLAKTKAEMVLNQGDADIDAAFQRLAEYVRRLSAKPGERIVAFISPGTASTEASRNLSELIDRAVKANVVVDTIDARGLYTPDLGDISEPSALAAQSEGAFSRFRMREQSLAGEILGSMAGGTGGTWFHNRNDIDVGLRRIISAPPVSYVLSFSPQNLKLDGHYHTLKVKVGQGRDLVVQARRGYFAPKAAKDPAAQAQAEIEEVLVSRDELNELPIELKTQFFMKDSTQATLSVLAHIDLKAMSYRKADGRNCNDLTLATAIFDQNGNYTIGGEQTLKMRMLDATLVRLRDPGLTVKSTYDLKPGTYLVRLVVRATESAQMAARNQTVVIPD